MAISIEEVDHISKLARLKFSDQEKQKLQQELSSILDYVNQVQQIAGKVDEKDLVDPDAINLMRDDVAEQLIDPERLLKQAPTREGNFVKVKSVLE